MNYYIQGNKDKADQIKAAFEKLGYDVTGFDMRNDNILFFTYKLQTGGKVLSTTNANIYTAEIIKTHPDYKELELPVEPKFKNGDTIKLYGENCIIVGVDVTNQLYNIHSDNPIIGYELLFKDQDKAELVEPQPKFKAGDWLVYKNGNCFAGGFMEAQVVKVKDGVYYFASGTSGSFKFIDECCRLWTIEDAKDGDVLVTTKIRSCPFIYRKTDYNNNLAYYYAGIDGNGNFCEGCLKRTLSHFGPVANVAPATKEHRDLLFKNMEEAGWVWDADKKELRKIKPHYDIANFHAGMPVLVRDNERRKWCYTLYSHYDNEDSYQFVTAGDNPFIQCIPFEGNETLLGTTDMCNERFINW